jgi:RNA-directed DNA polymerase
MTIFSDIQNKFFISTAQLKLLIETAPNRYKVHTIKKRHNRGFRTIAQPKAEIKALQKFVIEKYLLQLPVHPSATAYSRRKSIKDHAFPHASNKYLLKLDFSDFFNSILSQDFHIYLSKSDKFSSDDIDLMINLMFWKPKGQKQKILSIGAPSSPHLSNLLMFEFDSKLSNYCNKSSITYTRYADDIALSTNQPKQLDEVFKYISSLCISLESPKLVINASKTIFTSKKWNRSLTGITLSNNGSLSLGREKKRVLRATAYNYSVGKLDATLIPTLRGNLAFAYSIDPAFVESIRKMIGIDFYNKLMHF